MFLNDLNDDKNNEIMKRERMESLRSLLGGFGGSSSRSLIAWSLRQRSFTFFFFKGKGEWSSRVAHLQIEVVLT